MAKTETLTNNISIEKFTYEEAFNLLEKIVLQLETEEHSLSDTLDLFERGQAMARHCSNLLDKAELKVKQLSGDQINETEISFD